MKKLLTVLLLISFVTTAWAAPLSLVDRAGSVRIPVAINASDTTLEDFLSFLSEQTKITLSAVPEVAGIKINLQLPAGQTLQQVLDVLQQNYNLAFRANHSQTALVALKASYYNELTLAAPNSAAKTLIACREAYVPAPASGCWYPIPSYNTEEYKAISDNRFQDALTSALSTFSIDVDTASYSNVRRFINSGELPPADSIRTEEMINYFKYDYPQPTGEHPFSVTTEVGTCPWNPAHKLALIGLQGKNLAAENLPASNLVFLIDVSGSMADANKLPLLKTAFQMLVKQLRPQDKISIVVYSGAAGVVLEPTSGREKDKIAAAIESLAAGGSTAGGEGIVLAYKIAGENLIKGGNNRVILATDGDFNVGVTSEGDLTRLIEARRDDGISLSVLGFGMGNIKDNKMEALADKGNGNYAYIDNALEARKVMVGQMAGTLFTIAKDVKLQVEFNPAKVKSYRLIGYENRSLANSDFSNDKQDAGDMGAGHSVTALYEIIPADAADKTGTVEPLIYQRPELLPSDDLLQVKIRYKKPAENSSLLLCQPVGAEQITNAPSANFSFAAAVAEYAMLVRNSEFKGNASYNQVLELAKSARGQDEEGYRAEFIKLVEISKLLAEK